jgi:hypothetical protein
VTAALRTSDPDPDSAPETLRSTRGPECYDRRGAPVSARVWRPGWVVRIRLALSEWIYPGSGK